MLEYIVSTLKNNSYEVEVLNGKDDLKGTQKILINKKYTICYVLNNEFYFNKNDKNEHYKTTDSIQFETKNERGIVTKKPYWSMPKDILSKKGILIDIVKNIISENEKSMERNMEVGSKTITVDDFKEKLNKHYLYLKYRHRGIFDDFKRENPNIKLTERELTKDEIEKINEFRADFKYINFSVLNFPFTEEAINLSYANCEFCNFANVKFASGTFLQYINVSGSHFTNTILSYINIFHGQFNDCIFDKTIMENTTIGSANFTDSSFINVAVNSKTDMSNANFSSVKINSDMKKILHETCNAYFKTTKEEMKNERKNILLATATEIETQTLEQIFIDNGYTKHQNIRCNDTIITLLANINNHKIYHIQTNMGSIGTLSSASDINSVLNKTDLNIQYVIATGICCGLKPDKQKIGDILISSKIWFYESQKKEEDKTMLRGEIATASPILLSLFRKQQSTSEKHFGTIASGEKLVNSPAFIAEIKAFHTDAIGIEMEGAGIVSICNRCEIKTDWIVVKSISDWGDGNKNDDFQKLAAYNANTLVFGATINLCKIEK